MPIQCDLCGIELQTADLGQGEEIQGGKQLKFKDESGEYYVTRCDKCFEKNTSLTNYRKTEVYSRVVGYMRPVNQWHKGKQEEYKQRKEFKQMTDETPVTPEVATEEVVETPIEAPVETPAQ